MAAMRPPAFRTTARTWRIPRGTRVCHEPFSPPRPWHVIEFDQSREGFSSEAHAMTDQPPPRERQEAAAPQELPRGTRAVVDVRCEPSSSLAPLLEHLGISILVSAPHSGNLIAVAAPGGQLVLSFHTFERAMGVAVGRDVLAVCTHNEVWFLRNAPDIAAKLEPRGRYDACYLTRACHFTGDI